MWCIFRKYFSNVLLVPITSNRGLCGGFNANIIKQTLNLIRNDYAGKGVSILSIGKKSSEYFRNNNYNVISSHDEIFADLTYDNIAKISVIGTAMRTQPGIAKNMFEVLSEKQINMQVISTSEIKISVLIQADYTELAVRSLHDAFELDVID